MRVIVTIALASLVMFGATPSVGAGPLTVTEVTDFSNSGPGDIVGTLGVGMNTVSGHWSATTADNDTGDYFSLVLPAGMKVTSFGITEFSLGCCLGHGFVIPLRSEWTTDGPGAAFAPWAMGPGINDGLFATIAGYSGPSTFFAGFSGYPITLLPGGEVTGGGFDWEATYLVVASGDTGEPVPEPSAMALMGAGIATLVARRRKART